MEIIYKSSILDTIKLTNDDKNYLWFNFGIFDKPQSIENLKGKTTEIYKAINDSVIPFKSVANKKGTFYIDGYLEHTIILPNYYKNGNEKIVREYIKISKKINVVEK